MPTPPVKNNNKAHTTDPESGAGVSGEDAAGSGDQSSTGQAGEASSNLTDAETQQQRLDADAAAKKEEENEGLCRAKLAGDDCFDAFHDFHDFLLPCLILF